MDFSMLIFFHNMGKELPIPFQVYIVAKVFIHSAKREAFIICLIIKSKFRGHYCKVQSFEGRRGNVIGSFTLVFTMQQACQAKVILLMDQYIYAELCSFHRNLQLQWKQFGSTSLATIGEQEVADWTSQKLLSLSLGMSWVEGLRQLGSWDISKNSMSPLVYFLTLALKF